MPAIESDAYISEILNHNKIVFEDVKNQTTEDYFNNNQFSIDAFKKKYTDSPDETYVQALKRVCDYVASAEKTDELRTYWSERWFNEIYNDWWHPAGSIMQGAVYNRRISLANCTTISLGKEDKLQNWDNLESIIRNAAYTVSKCAAYRQGLGVDFSALRPADMTILNSANKSTGSVHWMKFIDSIGYYVGQKGRIPAMLFSLSCKHPDVIEFIKSKEDYTKIQNANISVQCTNDFYDAVLSDADWVMEFTIPASKPGDKIYIDSVSANIDSLKDDIGCYYIESKVRNKEVFTRTEKARTILELIAKFMTATAEPGIQNIDIAKKYSNSDYIYDKNDIYDSRILSTNACSEQYLSRESLCVLGSINAGKFSTSIDQYKQELSIIGKSINRFLDNVNECELKYNTYATPYQKLAIEKLRRTGAGYTNLAGWLFKNNLEYGSVEGNDIVAEFTKWYNYYLYKSSIELGKEKGSFGLFNRKKLEKSPFIQRMMDMGLVFDTLRNITCSSIAPTGTLTLMFRECLFSYGVEPAFGLYWWKRCRIAGKYEYYFCVPKIVKDIFSSAGFPIPMESDTIKDTWNGSIGRSVAEFIDKNKDKIGLKFKSSTEIKPLDKLDLMAKVMKYIDSSISVTYMLPEGSDWRDVYDFILEAYKREVKSIAAFPDRKMYGIVSFIPFKDLAFKLIKEGLEIHPQNFSENEIKELNISTETINTITKNAPKRLKSLECDIHHMKDGDDHYLFAVGLQNNQPYEIFGGKVPKNHKLWNQKNIKSGKITKLSSNNYKLECDELVVDNFNTEFTPIEQTELRLISTMMRHGIPIQFIVEQLQKSNNNMYSMPAVIARTLKKYIKNGERASGQSCSTCQSTGLTYLDGCVTCNNCGWSKCS